MSGTPDDTGPGPQDTAGGPGRQSDDRQSGGQAEEAGRDRQDREGESGRRSRATASGRRGRPLRGTTSTVAALLAVAVLGVGGWSVPEVRTVLKDSFTERQQTYIEMYFGKDPFFDGDELVVPLEVVEHGETGGKHAVRAWAEDAKGERLAARTESVTTKPGALIGVDVRLRLKGSGKKNADLVEVTLPGHSQRLRMHLR
ncbi:MULTISPECIES: hypothetical protein [Streptomyces]|uniref:Uncharacterized protein n=1 Tax=Streptomyces doebereineriae TaxID=3075528 RepID=A0ABU2VMT7_9ACTN|nr:hypothetical protein [Streptomyces sp. DSM 41640]MDT0486565.1 hypothetical protein [Streptomyces sp. DSM 41640]